MIFADLHYQQHYSEIHAQLVELIEANFDQAQHGLQGDSWIWIFDGQQKVEIDTFSSMKHQVKSAAPGCPLVDTVIAVLSTRYRLERYQDPQLEAHEEAR